MRTTSISQGYFHHRDGFTLRETGSSEWLLATEPAEEPVIAAEHSSRLWLGIKCLAADSPTLRLHDEFVQHAMLSGPGFVSSGLGHAQYSTLTHTEESRRQGCWVAFRFFRLVSTPIHRSWQLGRQNHPHVGMKQDFCPRSPPPGSGDFALLLLKPNEVPSTHIPGPGRGPASGPP